MELFPGTKGEKPSTEKEGLKNLHIPCGTKIWPERITTDWKRFSSGLWRIPEGDIGGAYCADTFPNLKVFTENGQLYTNLGSSGRSIRISSNCYPLLPIEAPRQDKNPFPNEGKVGKHLGKTFSLGPKVLFVASEADIEEWQNLFRVQYADGGWFSRQETYGEFLLSLPQGESESEEAALDAEKKGPDLQFKKSDMEKWLAQKNTAFPPEKLSQMNLF